MSTFIKHEILYNRAATTTATSNVVIGPIDIRNYEQFALMYQNNNTGTGFVEMRIEAAYDTSANAASEATNWVLINTATLPQPSGLGFTASVLTSAVDNVFSWIRCVAGTCAAATAGTFRLIVAGRRRT